MVVKNTNKYLPFALVFKLEDIEKICAFMFAFDCVVAVLYTFCT